MAADRLGNDAGRFPTSGLDAGGAVSGDRDRAGAAARSARAAAADKAPVAAFSAGTAQAICRDAGRLGSRGVDNPGSGKADIPGIAASAAVAAIADGFADPTGPSLAAGAGGEEGGSLSPARCNRAKSVTNRNGATGPAVAARPPVPASP